MPPAPGLLFTPTRIGAVTARNRLLMPAMVTNRAVGHLGTDAVIHHYAARAKGGAGVIVAEPIAVEASSLTLSGIMAGFDPRNRGFFRRLADAVEGEDCRLLGQIFHLGRHHITAAGRVSHAPTARPDPVSWAVPHRMGTAKVEDLAAAFVKVAEELRHAGFSGVELHGAQGFLIAQFLSPANDRDDGYGGDLAGRLRFVEQICDGIRAACGKDFVIGLKMPADEGLGAKGLTLEDTAWMVRRLAEARRVDLLSFGSGAPGPTFDQHVPDMTFPLAPFADQLPVLKEAAGDLPIVGLGRITDRAQAEALLETGACDLIGLGRPLLADADWPRKTVRGAPPKPCIYCNSCWAQLPKQHVLACVTNPLLGRPDEAGWSAARSKSPRKLLVVGGGVAGLSAAGALARRGHKVTLIERSDALGGLASWQAQLPGRAEVGKAVDHLAAEALAAGAQIRTGTEARLDLIAAEAPHAVIVATGARAGAPLVACREVHVADLVAETGALLAGRAAEGTAILFDRTQTEATYAAAELLAERYDRLIILSPRLGFATESALVSLPGIHRRLTAAGVEILTGAEPVSMEGRVLRWRSSWSGRISELPGINAFIHADARIATDNLVAAVEQIAIPAWAIGDALAPRNLLTAIHDGFSAAEEVERLLASSLETPHPTPARPVAA